MSKKYAELRGGGIPDGGRRYTSGVWGSRRSKNMKKKRRQRKKRSRPPTLAEVPFRELVQKDTELKKLREQYAKSSPKKRRAAAQWAHDSAQASMLMAQAFGQTEFVHPAWHDAAAPLAIDPEYAPAILTVGSLEYQYGRVDEAMDLFLKLTTFPADTEDLTDIIDKAGDFLIDQDDYENGERLYAAAVAAYPDVAIYHVGLGYCVSHNGREEESVEHHRRAVELEPDNYRHLNDLGYSLVETGEYDEAERVLRRAAQLAPPDYELAKGNLEHLRKLRSGGAGST
jgi:tetratricopeptide (TPR) repeat protein